MSTAITGTKIFGGELSGGSKLVVVTAPLTTEDDSITLTAATHGITAITSIVGAVITGGMDANFSNIQVSFSGLVLTVVSIEADGTVATNFTGATISVAVIGTM
jgi:hypothetical protein